jgi:hypothetical protein
MAYGRQQLPAPSRPLLPLNLKRSAVGRVRSARGRPSAQMPRNNARRVRGGQKAIIEAGGVQRDSINREETEADLRQGALRFWHR